ncbi:MAG: Trk family potassium uptake protein [Erysipelotrichaceae bacterium]|nr:Trk family potassium uptake protein [Erysipelotrichaceae bacterium]
MKQKSFFLKRKTRTYQLIILGFLLLILAGAGLLMLPVSSNSHTVTGFVDSLFTSVSATCVTGLVVRDTATHWSLFGQLVILFMIQIGGMGVVTVTIAFIVISGKQIGLWERSTMQETIGAPRISGIIRLTSFIIKTSLIIELIGAILLLPQFLMDFGFPKAIWYSIFHSVSAFCNAGFDLMGIKGPFTSFTSYQGSYYINIIIMTLIIVGGIGFVTWEDIKVNKFRIRHYSIQSKIILITTLLLIFIPAAFLFFFEFNDLPLHERILSSLFQSVTTRTAGFNTADLTAIDETGAFMMIVLMLIGGSPGSTAGGMKTTTIAVLFLSALTVFNKKHDVEAINRRLSEDTVRSAGAILFIYLVFFINGAIIISRVENIPLITCLFETASAIGTVGLTLGITASLSVPSKIILMILMFFGRIGCLTIIYAAVPGDDNKTSRLPLEKVAIG